MLVTACLFLIGLLKCSETEKQTTAILGDNFEDKIITLGIDTNSKNTDTVAVTSLDVSSSTITDLTDIQIFVTLTTLNCSSNQLNSLNVSEDVALIDLNCHSNHLANLNVSGATALTVLNCRSNQLTNLNISRATVLSKLDCRHNQLTSLDVSEAIVLAYLGCQDNELTRLSVARNTTLIYLDCSDNELASQMSKMEIILILVTKAMLLRVLVQQTTRT